MEVGRQEVHPRWVVSALRCVVLCCVVLSGSSNAFVLSIKAIKSGLVCSPLLMK